MLRRLKRSESGFTFIEVLVALAIMSAFAVTFLGGLATSSRAVMLADERLTAETLARSQMEYVKIESYIAVTVPAEVASYERIGLSELDVSSGYSIWSWGRAVEGAKQEVDGVVGVPWDALNDSETSVDYGLQKISLVIKHGEKIVLELEDYKANR